MGFVRADDALQYLLPAGLHPARGGLEGISLLRSLALFGDTYAINSLAALGDASSAPLIAGLTGHESAETRAAARRALAQLAPSAEASAALAQNLQTASPVEQLLAVDTLAQQPDAAATAALLDALLIDDFFIRTTAWDALLARTGTPPTTGADDFGPLSALHLRVLTSIKAIWHPAATRAVGWFKRLLAGEPPESVLPAYVPGDPTLRSLALAALRKGGDDPIDLTPLRLLEGHDRAWFEAALLTRVGRQEPRAIDAAAALEIKGLTGALHESRKRWAPMSDEVRVAVEMALLHLGRPR